MIILKLIQVFLLLGAFSFGGGLGSMELIRSRVVDQQMWLTNAEFTDIISISEMTPGPLGINIASFVGTRVAGVPGTIAATLSYVAPAVVIVILMAKVYFKYRDLGIVKAILNSLHPAVAAMVISAALRLCANAWWGGAPADFRVEDLNYIGIGLSFVMLVLLQKKKLGPVQAILFSGVIGAVLYALVPIIS